MLGATAFNELHLLFKERFMDDDGVMLPETVSSSTSSEEKTNDMQQHIVDMQAYVVQRCGGSILEACEAVFNVQRLVALEGGLKEAEKKLEELLCVDEVEGAREFNELGNSFDSLGSDKTVEGEFVATEEDGLANESKEEDYNSDEFEEYEDDAAM